MSASLDFGTTGCEKRDLAVGAATSDRLPQQRGRQPDRRDHRQRRTSSGSPPAAVASTNSVCFGPSRPPAKAPLGVRGDLASAIDALRRPERRRGMAVVISDFLGPINWMRPLPGDLRPGRCSVSGHRPRDVELPAVGDVILQDTESGVTREFTIDEQLRDDFAAPPRPTTGGRTLRPLWGSADDPAHRPRWIADIVQFVASRRRGAMAAVQ